MNVQLRIGYTIYIMPIADAAKVMELLTKATSCDSFYVGEYDGRESVTGYRITKGESLVIEQANTNPISTEEYEALYRPYADYLEGERAAKKAAKEAEAN